MRNVPRCLVDCSVPHRWLALLSHAQQPIVRLPEAIAAQFHDRANQDPHTNPPGRRLEPMRLRQHGHCGSTTPQNHTKSRSRGLRPARLHSFRTVQVVESPIRVAPGYIPAKERRAAGPIQVYPTQVLLVSSLLSNNSGINLKTERINPAFWHADWRFALRVAGAW